jgi:hypothetical protein
MRESDLCVFQRKAVPLRGVPRCSGVLGTTHGGVRHSFVIQQYPESSPLEPNHSFFLRSAAIAAAARILGTTSTTKGTSLPFLHRLRCLTSQHSTCHATI